MKEPLYLLSSFRGSVRGTMRGLKKGGEGNGEGRGGKKGMPFSLYLPQRSRLCKKRTGEGGKARCRARTGAGKVEGPPLPPLLIQRSCERYTERVKRKKKR